MADPGKDQVHVSGATAFGQSRMTYRSASLSIPMNASYENEDAFISHTGPLHKATPQFAPVSGREFGDQTIPGKQYDKQNAVMPEEIVHKYSSDDSVGRENEHLLKSGPLGLCNDPDCVHCPGAYKTKRTNYKRPFHLDSKLHDILYGDSEGWARKSFSFLSSYFPIMNPHTRIVQKWNRFFVISCLVAIFIDPLFFFLFSVEQIKKCIVLNWSLATAIAAVRSLTDFIYFLHMLLQFRLAYVAPESRVVGAGDLVDQPKKIALHYLRGYFMLDLFIVFPLPQVIILVVIPKYLGSAAANYAKNLLRGTILLQYIPRILRIIPLVAGQSASGFIFESAWANFVINLLMFILAGHVVGSCWYLFGLQLVQSQTVNLSIHGYVIRDISQMRLLTMEERVNQCLHDACSDSHIPLCRSFIDCGRGNNIEQFIFKPSWQDWLNEPNSTDCFVTNGHFNYGVYVQTVLLTAENSIVRRYIYALFWGFQQISTLAGNLVPSYFEWEVLFVMAIIGLGLLLFALLIGNMQNFLQALGRRRLEMQLRRRDVELWMSHRRLPEARRRQVRQAERYSWAATRGVDEEELLNNLPEDLQREIRRHYFKFLKNVRIFSLMDEPMLDAVYAKLRQKIFIRGSDILFQGGPIEKMLFIVRGKLESIGADGNTAPLSEGDVCGEELLTWCLEHSSVSKDGGKIKFPGQRLLSSRTVRCLTNVEAFALRVADLEEVTKLFARFLRNPRVQGAIRYESPYWRTVAATRIQVAWRYRQRLLKRTSCSGSPRSSTRPTYQLLQNLSEYTLARG